MNMGELGELLGAQALRQVVGGEPIMTRDEAREWLELEPWDETDEPDEPAPAQAPPPADDMQPNADPNARGASTDITDDAVTPEQAKSWLRLSLANVRDGKGAAVGTPWDAELLFAKTGRQVRTVYESHWPRKNGGDDMAAAIQRAADVLEVFNTLAMNGQKD